MPESPTPLRPQERRSKPVAKKPEGIDPQSELELCKEEILRLRDLLVARDAELGAARGRLAQLEQHSERVARLAARIPIPGVGRLLAGLARLLRV